MDVLTEVFYSDMTHWAPPFVSPYNFSFWTFNHELLAAVCFSLRWETVAQWVRMSVSGDEMPTYFTESVCKLLPLCYFFSCSALVGMKYEASNCVSVSSFSLQLGGKITTVPHKWQRMHFLLFKKQITRQPRDLFLQLWSTLNNIFWPLCL